MELWRFIFAYLNAAEISNCSNKGDIYAYSVGVIANRHSSSTANKIKITNCEVRGNITSYAAGIGKNAEAEIEYNGTFDITTGDFLFSVSQEVVASTGETDSFYANVYYDRDLNNWYQETDGTYISMGEANGNVEMVAALVSQSFVTGLLSSATEASQFAIDENEDGTKIKVTTTTPSDSNVTLEFYVLFDAAKNFSAFSLETEASNLGYGAEGSGSILVEFKTSTEGVTAPTNIA